MRGFFADVRLSRQMRKETARLVKEQAVWRYVISYFDTKRAYFQEILDVVDNHSLTTRQRENEIIRLCESGLYLNPIKEKRKWR